MTNESPLCKESGYLRLTDRNGHYISAYPSYSAFGDCSFSDFEEEEDILGRGTFGEVRRATHIRTGAEVVIKDLIKQVDFSVIRKEECVHHSLRSKLVARHFCTMVSTEGHVAYVMECASGMDLFRARPYYNRLPIDWIAAQVVLILEYLRANHVVYRDLKPENVMYNPETHRVKLIDFGLAENVEGSGGYAHGTKGTTSFMAPEVIKGHWYSYQADWYSFGVLVYELVTGQNPFDRYRHDPNLRAIVAEGFKCRIPDERAACSLIGHLTKLDQKVRWGNSSETILLVRNHRFFADVRWDALERGKIPLHHDPTDTFDCPNNVCPWEDPLRTIFIQAEVQ